MSYYHANESGEIPGKLPDTWWEGGALFMTLMQYWYFTGDESYNPTVMQGMLLQAGEDANYLPSNWSSWLVSIRSHIPRPGSRSAGAKHMANHLAQGNDDQVFWGLAAITAAELKYPNPPDKEDPSWVALAQGVYNTQYLEWDTKTCGGGLRWQLHPYQAGYDLKNSVSNGGLFQLAARLAMYTDNSSYADFAETIWDWTASTPLLSEQDWNVADSTNPQNNCSEQGNLQWTYNYAIYMMGAAYMYNYVRPPPPFHMHVLTLT